MGFFPFMGIGIFFLPLIHIAIAYLVYRDAQSRGLNGLLWAVLTILPMVGLVFLVIYLVVREQSSSPVMASKSASNMEKTAEDILAERYARGEISRDDYFKMKEDITSSKKE
jgi:putative membrane protein